MRIETTRSYYTYPRQEVIKYKKRNHIDQIISEVCITKIYYGQDQDHKLRKLRFNPYKESMEYNIIKRIIEAQSQLRYIKTHLNLQDAMLHKNVW